MKVTTSKNNKAETDFFAEQLARLFIEQAMWNKKNRNAKTLINIGKK